jgi:dTDP-glucose pyrophosphorylase
MQTDKRIDDLIVGPDESVARALQVMDASGDRIVLVTDEERVLLGVVTDGDVRRWILGGNDLAEPVSRAMSASPLTLSAGSGPDEARALMVERRVECIPLVDERGRVVSAVWWLDLFESPAPVREQIDTPVVVMAGGKGTRLSPYTNILPKPLMPLGDQTILELILDRFSAYGADRFFVTLNYKANLIKAYFADVETPYDITYVHETEPLGTGGSLSLMRDLLDRTFILTNCDIVVDADYADIVRYHREHGNMITLIASTRHETIPYGVCEVAEGGALVSIREKPQFNFLVSTGFYVIEPSILDRVPDGTFIHMTDIINGCLADGLPVGVYPVSERSWVDIGEFESLQDTLTHFGLV